MTMKRVPHFALSRFSCCEPFGSDIWLFIIEIESDNVPCTIPQVSSTVGGSWLRERGRRPYGLAREQ